MTIDLAIKNNADYEKTILVIGVVHGDERQGKFFIENYLKSHKNKTGKNRVVFIPELNKSKTRKNKNGVDLNRNFPTKNWVLQDKSSNYFGGKKPASEEETRFIVELFNNYKFDAVITIHAPFKIVNYDCFKNCKITPKLAETISKITGYPIQKDIGYPTPGSFGTWAGVEKGIPTITIEVDEEIEPKKLTSSFEKLFEYLENEF